MITIVDYGMGNLKSIQNMFKKAGSDTEITSDIDKIIAADKIILPGVGSFDNAMNNIKSKNFLEVLNQKVLVEKTPILGICLGMQIMCNSSEEGQLSGLSWIDAKVNKFNFSDSNFKVPHMGWNEVTPKNYNDLFAGMDNEEIKYYHVHSYFVSVTNKEEILATTNYGFDFVSSFKKDNIYGVQFHPEKSHRFGLQMLKNFASL